MKYTVKAGDNEAELATRNHISVGDLRTANAAQPQPYLVEGREIELPIKQDAKTVDDTAKQDNPFSSTVTYTPNSSDKSTTDEK